MYYYSEKAICSIIKVSYTELEHIIDTHKKDLQQYYVEDNTERKWCFKGILILRRLCPGKIIEFPLPHQKQEQSKDLNDEIRRLTQRVAYLEKKLLEQQSCALEKLLHNTQFSSEVSY